MLSTCVCVGNLPPLIMEGEKSQGKHFGVTHFQLKPWMKKKISPCSTDSTLKAPTWPRQKPWPMLGDAVKALESCRELLSGKLT